jgi:cytochrome P450
VNPPVVLRGFDAIQSLGRFLLDPLAAVQRGHDRFGTFVILVSPFRLVKYQKKVVAVAIGSKFNREVLTDNLTWRPASVMPGGPKNSASRRLGIGIIRMQGREYDHYRRLLSAPLRRKIVDSQANRMASFADDEVGSWPLNEAIDLWEHARKLMQAFAIRLLFGDDRDHGCPIAELTNRWVSNTWSLKVSLCPVNLPGTPYRRKLQDGATLERGILDWAACKRKSPESDDLLVINSPDENGKPATDAKIVGHVPTLLAAAFETCQNALIWTLILLGQHPRIARDLLDEIRGRLGGAPPSLERIADLPLLDAVLKESLRILPPVPQQFRVANMDTTLAGFPLPKDTRVLISPFLTNRDRDLYPEPDRFRPERWNRIDPSPFEYLVFSAGPRSCPGYWFGLGVLKVAVATILTRFRIAFAPHARIDHKVRLALTPHGRVPAMLLRQDGAFVAEPIRGSIRTLVWLPS